MLSRLRHTTRRLWSRLVCMFGPLHHNPGQSKCCVYEPWSKTTEMLSKLSLDGKYQTQIFHLIWILMGIQLTVIYFLLLHDEYCWAWLFQPFCLGLWRARRESKNWYPAEASLQGLDVACKGSQDRPLWDTAHGPSCNVSYSVYRGRCAYRNSLPLAASGRRARHGNVVSPDAAEGQSIEYVGNVQGYAKNGDAYSYIGTTWWMVPIVH